MSLTDRIAALEANLSAAQEALSAVRGTAPYVYDGAGNLLGLATDFSALSVSYYDVQAEVLVKVYTRYENRLHDFLYESNDCSGTPWMCYSSLPGAYAFGYLDHSDGTVCRIPDVPNDQRATNSRRATFDETGTYECLPANGEETGRPCMPVGTVVPGVYIAPGP